MSDDLTVRTLGVDEARRLTDEIRTALVMTWELVQAAYVGRAWVALGYSSWDAYCEQEFRAGHLRLPREERQEVVGSLREAGLSTRAIAAATGLGKGTIGRELAGAPNGAPETVIGTDGKTYSATQPAEDEVPMWYILLSNALQSLREAEGIAEKIAETDKAEALKCYREIIGVAAEGQNIAAEHNLRAQRELGLLGD